MDKNILAFFHTPEEAEGVNRKLQALRVEDTKIQRFGKYPEGGIDHIMNPLTGDFHDLGNLVQDTTFSDKQSGILAAADIDASGMSDGGQGGPTGRDILLTVVVKEEDFDKAMRIIEEAGGLV